MKKQMLSVLLAVGLLLGLSSSAFAVKQVRAYPLNDAAGTAINNYALTDATAVYSETIKNSRNSGYASILVIEDKTGGAGDVDISCQYSLDGTTWYSAYTTDMAGTITVEGNIVTALQNVTRWIVHTVRVAPYMRYKFDPDANSEITAYIIYQEEN